MYWTLRLVKATLFSFLFISSALETAFGQAPAPVVSLVGKVEATDHQPVSGVSVAVVFMPMSFHWAATTNRQGQFTLPELPAGGPYVIQASQPGYKTQLLNDVYLTADDANVVTVTLVRQGNAPATGKPAPAVLTASIATPAATRKTAVTEPPRTYEYTSRRRAELQPIVVAPPVPGHYDAKTRNYVYETGAPITLRLPGGRKVEGVGTNSTENRLGKTLADPSVRIDTVHLTEGWLNFDKVFFESGKATLTPESMSQLRNIATMLQAYPKARIKIGGYTDNVGDYKLNRNLSEARARMAWVALIEMGVSPRRIDARGYGANYPIADNSTEEGRAMNRRLSVKLLAK